MLAVTVHLHGAVEALAQGKSQASLHRAADAKITAQPDHAGAVRAGDVSGPIRRGIVDDHDFRCETVALGDGTKVRKQRGQAALFVQCGHNDKNSHPAGRTISRRFARCPSVIFRGLEDGQGQEEAAPLAGRALYADLAAVGLGDATDDGEA